MKTALGSHTLKNALAKTQPLNTVTNTNGLEKFYNTVHDMLKSEKADNLRNRNHSSNKTYDRRKNTQEEDSSEQKMNVKELIGFALQRN